MEHLFNIPDRLKPKICLKQEGEKDITYGEINDLFNDSIVHTISNRIVCCICTQTSSCVAGFFALEIAGAVPLMVSRKNTSFDNLNELVKQFNVSYLWIPYKTYIDLNLQNVFEIFRYRDYILLEIKKRYDQRKTHQDLALLLATSGSTGDQKFVKLSKNNIRTSIEIINEIAGFKREDVGLVYLPLEHCFTVGLIHALFEVGACIMCAPGGLMELGNGNFVDRNDISILITVTFIIDFLRKTDFFIKNHPSLRIIANGAGNTPIETQGFLNNYMKQQNGKLIVTYGQTEVTIVASAIPEKDIGRIYNSIGKPYGDIEMFVENADEKGIGELVIKSKAVMMGYAYSFEDLTLGSVTNGVLHTGDLVYKDKEGFYYIKGRIARFAKINGKRFSLNYIEKELEKEFSEQRFACVSDDKKIYVIGAPVINNKNDIKLSVAKITGIHDFLIECQLVNELPVNDTGKIQYRNIIKMFTGEENESL